MIFCFRSEHLRTPLYAPFFSPTYTHYIDAVISHRHLSLSFIFFPHWTSCQFLFIHLFTSYGLHMRKNSLSIKQRQFEVHLRKYEEVECVDV